MTIGQFIHILSSRLELTPGKALFVFVKNTLPQTGKIGHLIHLDIVAYTHSNLLTRAIYLQQVKWIQSMNLTRMMMDFCICATAARKHLVKAYLPFPWIVDFCLCKYQIIPCGHTCKAQRQTHANKCSRDSFCKLWHSVKYIKPSFNFCSRMDWLAITVANVILYLTICLATVLI
jgi:hypothetical protein